MPLPKTDTRGYAIDAAIVIRLESPGVRPMWMATELVFPALLTGYQRMTSPASGPEPSRGQALPLVHREPLPGQASSQSELHMTCVRSRSIFANQYREDHPRPPANASSVLVNRLGNRLPHRFQGIARTNPLSNDARRLALTDPYTGPVEDMGRAGARILLTDARVQMLEDLTWRLNPFEE